MQGNVSLGRIWGIPIGLNVSWFLIFGLVTWSLASGYFPTEYPNMPAVAYWFFGSVLAHELGHSFVALRHSIPVRGITLFIFGGVAQIESEPKTPGAEFRIAIAGPAVSLGLAAFFNALFLLDQAIPYLAMPSAWLARINLTLALFNLIPGFPLDGGRVLRAIVWKATGDLHRSTGVATSAGQLVAFGFIGIGLFTTLTAGLFNGLWLVLIGWFLQNAAASAYAQSTMQQLLRGVTVGQVMARECSRVPAGLSLEHLVENHVLQGGRRCFFIDEGEGARGMITLSDVTAIPRSRWPGTSIEEVMLPADRIISVRPDTELLTALKKMDERQVAQVPVVSDGDVVGLLSREQVLHWVRLRSEIGI